MTLGKVFGTLEEGRDQHFDPKLLSCFLAIPPDLHEELSSSEIAQLRLEMYSINELFFSSGMEVLPV